MVDLMNLLSDVLIGSFQMLMLNDLGKNMFPYRIKTCWTKGYPYIDKKAWRIKKYYQRGETIHI